MNMENDYLESQHALLIAYQTMKERCQQLQARLAKVEDENTCLRQQYEKHDSMAIMKTYGADENNVVQNQQVCCGWNF